MTPATIRARLASAIKAAVNYLQGRHSVKSVQGYVDNYTTLISEIVTDVFNGDAVRVDVSLEMYDLLKTEAEGVYAEGMIESGQYENEDEAREALDDDDYSVISDWQAEQKKHVKDFSLAVEEAARPNADGSPNTAAQQAILNRIELWGLSLRDLGSAGKAKGLLEKDPYVTWHLGKTEVHCQDKDGKTGCAQLAGKRKRLSEFLADGYIPQQNASETLTCGGWACECELRNDKGKRVLPA